MSFLPSLFTQSSDQLFSGVAEDNLGFFRSYWKLLFQRQLFITLDLDTTSVSLIYTNPNLLRPLHHKVIGNARSPLDRSDQAFGEVEKAGWCLFAMNEACRFGFVVYM
jgi:hypothetical protein